MTPDHYQTSTAPLTPAPAAAAILLAPDGRYLMQLRDNIPTIWFPGHWGLFGGGIEAGETPEQALLRELEEELAVRPHGLRYFTRIDFDFSFAGGSQIPRWYYEGELDAGALAGARLGEGREMRLVTVAELRSVLRITPYDAFALFLHTARAHIEWG